MQILLSLSTIPLTAVIKLLIRQGAMWWLKDGEQFPGQAHKIADFLSFQYPLGNIGLFSGVPALLLVFTIGLVYSSISPVRKTKWDLEARKGS